MTDFQTGLLVGTILGVLLGMIVAGVCRATGDAGREEEIYIGPNRVTKDKTVG